MKDDDQENLIHRYRQTVIHNLPQLEKLDNVNITSEERVRGMMVRSLVEVFCFTGRCSVWDHPGDGERGGHGGHFWTEENKFEGLSFKNFSLPSSGLIIFSFVELIKCQ